MFVLQSHVAVGDVRVVVLIVEPRVAFHSVILG